MRRPHVTPRTFQRITGFALVALAFIIVTGAAVRLTGSGLGCPDWPTCAEDRVVAPLEYHAMVEFVNRIITGLVSLTVVLAVLGSLFREPRRRDLTWLSLGLVGGVLAQIVLGGLVVKFHLAPGLVMLHFSVSMVLLWDAVVLHHRAAIADDAVGDRALVAPWARGARRLLVATAGLVIFLGTVVTGSGPHTGDHEGQFIDRLPFRVSDVARVHGAAVWVFCALVVIVAVRLRRTGAPPDQLGRASVLLAVLVTQAAVGYAQYLTGVPALLVGIHVAGAVAVWVAVLRLVLGMRVARREGVGPTSPVTTAVPEPSEAVAVT